MYVDVGVRQSAAPVLAVAEAKRQGLNVGKVPCYRCKQQGGVQWYYRSGSGNENGDALLMLMTAQHIHTHLPIVLFSKTISNPLPWGMPRPLPPLLSPSFFLNTDCPLAMCANN